MTTSLKYANKVFVLALLLTILINITVPDMLPSLTVQANAEQPEAFNCVLYPLGLSSQSIANLEEGSTFEMNVSEQSESFSWLTWTGNPNANLLAASLTPPGNSETYVNPNDTQDNIISKGDWVMGVPGVVNSNGVKEALEKLTNTVIVVPVFDATQGEVVEAAIEGNDKPSEGSEKANKDNKNANEGNEKPNQENKKYFNVASFARVKLLDFDFTKGNHFNFQYLGTGCETVSLEVGKTVESATLSHELSASLSVDKEFAIPADTLTYTTTITESVSDLVVTGTFMVTNSGDSPAKILYFYDLIDTKQADSGVWKNLAGISFGMSNYIPLSLAPLQTGMALTATGIPADGVTYPGTGNGITGTVLSAGSTATWTYTATVALPADQLTPLLDSSSVSEVRNNVHFEITGSGDDKGLEFNASTDFTKALQPQMSVAANTVSAQLTLPDGSTVTPVFAASAVSGPATATTTYQVPVVPGRGPDETEDAYLERLNIADKSVLKATLDVNTPSGPLPQSAVSTILQLPIVTVDKSGPATVEPGQTVAYDLSLINGGSAPTSYMLVMDLMDFNNSFGEITGVPSILQPGPYNGVSVQSIFNLPFPETLDYRLPNTINDVVSVNWLDDNGNYYGELTDSFSSVVVSPYANMTLQLSPLSAGPNLTGTQQTLTATLLDEQLSPVSGAAVYFVIDGPNASTFTQMTGTDGTAVMSYTGVNNGFDNVKAYVITGLAPLESNSAAVHWITPIKNVTTSPIHAEFFSGSNNGAFNISPSAAPLFEQTFPAINFNPPVKTVLGTPPSIGPRSRPFTDIVMDLSGNYAGTIQAAGNGYVAAGDKSLYVFSTVFTGEFTVAKAGEVTFTVYSDDGFIFGIGNGAVRINGAWTNPPTSELTPFENYPVMAVHNEGTAAHARPVTVNFPAPGVYPFELDYTENGGWDRSLVLVDQNTGLSITPSTSLTLSPFTSRSSRIGTQVSYTAKLVDASGLAMPGIPVTFRVRGVNAQEVTTVTGSDGTASFSFTSAATGSDYVQAFATVNGKVIAISAEAPLTWTP